MADDLTEITDEQLAAFKERMHILHKSEDDYLKRLIKQSRDYVFGVGSAAEMTGKAEELVYERARYAYNDHLEEFDTNFRPMLMNLSIDNMPDIPDTDEKGNKVDDSNTEVVSDGTSN
ncbi:hypothetical protein PQ472_07740 [Lacticaseibacillus pabuli]|uniref:Phage gp6-like head-tail connector protein n=1 Tax=Lacticaseibacillus pabuli TaxID=3025672 RepID=A0ABY7WS78_9LACO|nr:hypothetical protein [Lacticaseibacillus sp. KACC 23028]WDF81816.1 hypothetical protein PQ472_07740 [Lacticaseibacillus sp. KACC 23028]